MLFLGTVLTKNIVLSRWAAPLERLAEAANNEKRLKRERTQAVAAAIAAMVAVAVAVAAVVAAIAAVVPASGACFR